MLTIYSVVNFIAAAAMFSFALIIYLGNRTEETQRYAIYSAFTGGWALFVGVALFLPPEQSDFVMYALRLSYWSGLSAAVGFYSFALAHREPEWIGVRAKRLFFGLYIFLFLAYVMTDSIVRDVAFGTYQFERIPLYNWAGFFVFNGVFTLFTTSAFYRLYKKWCEPGTDLDRSRTRDLLFCGMFAFTPPIILSVLLPLLNNFRFYWIAPLLSTMWVIATTYGIFKHRVFQLRVITAEVLFVFLLIILFVNIFVPENTTEGLFRGEEGAAVYQALSGLIR